MKYTKHIQTVHFYQIQLIHLPFLFPTITDFNTLKFGIHKMQKEINKIGQTFMVGVSTRIIQNHPLKNFNKMNKNTII